MGPKQLHKYKQNHTINKFKLTALLESDGWEERLLELNPFPKASSFGLHVLMSLVALRCPLLPVLSIPAMEPLCTHPAIYH